MKINTPDAETKVHSYGYPDPSCVVDYSDKALDKDLTGSGKQVGGWSTTGSIAIRSLDRSPKVESSDLPINMQVCERLHPLVSPSHTEEVNLEKMPETCKLYSVHIHDGKENQSTHLRIRCEKAGDEELKFLANTVFQTQVIGRAICRGEKSSNIREQMFFEARESARDRQAGLI